MKQAKNMCANARHTPNGLTVTASENASVWMPLSGCHPEGQSVTVSTGRSISGSHRVNEIPNSIVEQKTPRQMFRDDRSGLISHNLLLTYLPTNLLTSAAFTMAEILLSLTIIGVVAAITLPSLTGNINERTWNTQRKALYARMSQAISLMPALNGYGTLTEGDSSTSAVDTATETFLTAGLSKVLKINNICDNTHLADCGVVTSFTNMGGSQVNTPTTLYELSSWFEHVEFSGSSYETKDTKAAAFETQNGESIVAYYNQSCRTQYLNQESLTAWGNLFGFPQSNMCVNFIYDLNGTKGPNTVGKDIGIMTVFNATDSSVVAPMPTSATNAGGNAATYSWHNAAKACTGQDSESRLPNIDEASAMMINQDVLNITNSRIWASTVYNSERAWNAAAPYGNIGTEYKANPYSVRCVKR